MKIVDIYLDYFKDNPQRLQQFRDMFYGPRYL